MLCVVCEGPTHGFRVAGLGLRCGTGQIWFVSKPSAYAALLRLEALELIRTVRHQRTSLRPSRSVVQATPAGRATARAWLDAPVQDVSEIRSELMVKLALLDRSGLGQRNSPRRSSPD